MQIGKKELRLLIILGLIVYGYLLYQFVIVKALPKLTEVERKITVVKEQKAKLDNDIKNKELKKIDLNAKTVSYEKTDGYIPENADVTNTVEYIEKLSRLLGKEFENVSIDLPVELSLSGATNNQSGATSTSSASASPTTAGTTNPNSTSSDTSQQSGKYYKLSCDFEASLTYNEVIELLNFIEGSTKRVSISEFSLVPEDELKDKTGTPSPTPNKTGAPEEQKFKVNMTINLYSINANSNDFGSSRFSRFIENGWVIKGADAGNSGVGGSQAIQTSASGTAGTAGKASTSVFQGTDLAILESSVMASGDNLCIYGVNPQKDSITLKTAGRIDVKLKVDANSYTVEATRTASGKVNSFRSSIANKKEINVKVLVDLTDITENKDIALNITVTNNTSKKINVLLSDSDNRVKITDRSGSVINKKSDREKLQIL